jgi:hypothetical protein
VFSCKEPCLDIPLIDEKTEEMQAWYTDQMLVTKLAESSIGISDEVILNHDFQNFGDTIWDDCGNASESERSTVLYNFFNFPFTIETVFNKQGEEKGFSFRVNYNMYSAKYKFTSQSSSSNNTIEYITDYELNDVIYPEAFKITFNQTQDDIEIHELIFIKELGIIYITLNDGIDITLN